MKPQAHYDALEHRDPTLDGRIRKAGELLARFAPKQARLLDIGCGNGGVAAYFAQRIGAKSAHGIEITEKLLDEARGAGVDARRVDLDAEDIPFESGSMDAIHCGEVIEHLFDTDHLAAEIRRLLSPEGICVLSTPNLASWCNRGALLFGYQPFLSEVSIQYAPGRPWFARADRGGSHLRIFTHRALREFVRWHGFDIVAERGVGFFELAQPPGSRLVQRLVAPLDAFFTRFPTLACDSMVALRRR